MAEPRIEREWVSTALRRHVWPEPAPAARITWFGHSIEQAREGGGGREQEGEQWQQQRKAGDGHERFAVTVRQD